jgi:hypothetical protein
MGRALLSCAPHYIEEQTMQKARKSIPQTVGRDARQSAKTVKTGPKPLDPAAQRMVGGGKSTSALPVKFW